MRLRAQLILAFFLLAVLPLAVATLYSYNASLTALRLAVEKESEDMAREMEGRMSSVTGDLRSKIDRLSRLPLWAVHSEETPVELQAQIRSVFLAEMGDSARFFEHVEFLPPESPEASGAPEPVHGERVQISLSIDLDDSNEEPVLEGLYLVMEKGGEVTMGSQLNPPLPPEVPPLTLLGPGKETGQLAADTRGWARGLESLARELEERDRLRRAGVEVPAVDVEELRSQLAREMENRGEVERERIGAVRAQISSREVLRQVMSRTRRDRGEVPFAVDDEGRLFTPDPADRTKLAKIGLHDIVDLATLPEDGIHGDWVTVRRLDPNSGLQFGIARPVGDAMSDLRSTAVRNMGLGMGMVGLAILGILPLSGRMTRNLQQLTRGAETLAKGDLDARVPVQSRDEFGALATAFNRMAGELKRNQKQLLEQERLRKEVEIGHQIQQELLPQGTLRLPFAEIRGISIPAREVGGDFYNYFTLPSGEIAILVGDVAGKGVPAALLMANLQAMLRAILPMSSDLAKLVDQVDRDVEASTPASLYVTLFVALLDPTTRQLNYVNGGHNPPFVICPDGTVEHLATTGRPVGLVAGKPYEQATIDLPPGSVLFLYTDGLTESENPAGEQFGMERLEAVLLAESSASLDNLLQRVEESIRAFSGPGEAADDATMVALRLASG